MRSLFAGFALLALGITGCGSSAMLSPAGAPEPAAQIAAVNVRGNFFPLVTGRYLSFRPSDAELVAQPGPDYTVDVRGPAPQWGRSAMEVLDSEARFVLSSDKGGVTMNALADGPSGTIRKFSHPVRLVTYPLRVGRIWTDNYGAGARSIHVRHWVADLLTVHTPQGTYQAFQIERHVWRGTSKPAFYADGIDRTTVYYAKDIGPVQIGTHWPGVTYTTYQLSSLERPALIQADDVPPADSSRRGLTAGLEALVRN
jgi:hypothetical protein